jgi:hypothetical protein
MGCGNAKEISLGEGFGEVALKVNGAVVEVHADGSVAAHTAGDVDAYTNASVRVHGPANDSASKAAHEIGAIESTGEHKGEIYGGILPSDKKPIWFSQLAPKLMDHYTAAAWAEEQGGSLPTRKQGDYLDTIKDQGAFKTLFNLSGSFPAGSVWLAEPLNLFRDLAWCQRLSDSGQIYGNRDVELPVLSVFR